MHDKEREWNSQLLRGYRCCSQRQPPVADAPGSPFQRPKASRERQRPEDPFLSQIQTIRPNAGDQTTRGRGCLYKV